MDRDIRVTPEQITYLENLARKRVAELGHKISRAEGSQQAGHTIQRGTLQAHYEELKSLELFRVTLDVARRQIQHQYRVKLGLAEPFSGS